MAEAERKARYERLVNRHKDAVYRQIARVCGNYDDTEDVLVETLLTAYRALDQVQDEGAMRGWLATIGRRICRRLKSKEALRPIVQLESADEPGARADLDDQLEMNRLKACIAFAIESLPERYRAVYLMREIESRTAGDTAGRLGLSIANVKSRLHRARAIVRKALDHSLCSLDS